MSDLIKKIKIKKQDGTFTDYIPIGAEAQNVSTSDGDSVQLKLNKKPYYYNSVADMKADTKLKAGDMAVTFGYYEPNDGGAGEYRIVSTTNEYVEILNNNLKAELIIKNEINVKQLGAYGDGVHDDTSAIQNAFDNFSNIIISEGIYMIDAVTQLYPRSNNRILLDNNAILRVIPNNATNYAIFWIEDVVQLEIAGGTLQGDRASHIGTTGEWGHCIRLCGNSDKIYIHDINLTDAWGDGIACKATGTIMTERVHVNNARRNGYSIGNCGKFISTNDFIENTNGTAPQDGVDIEPDTDNQSVYAIFNNLTTKNNTNTGFGVWHKRNNTLPMHIELNNYKGFSDGHGIWLATGENAKGEIIINNPIIKDPAGRGVEISLGSTQYMIKINKILLDGYHASVTAAAGLNISGVSGAIVGNVEIVEPIIINPINPEGVTNVSAIRTESISNDGYYDNIKIINPINLGGKSITTNGKFVNSVFSDDFEILKSDQDSNLGLSNQLYTFFTSTNYTADRLIRLNQFPLGATLTFINTGNYNMKIRFQEQYIYPLTITLDPTITLASKGAVLKVRKISDTEWTVLNSSGTINV